MSQSTSQSEPMIKLEPGGRAPILSYNVPEPTSYSGRNIINLTIDRTWFRDEPSIGQPPIGTRAPLTGVTRERLVEAIRNALQTGFFDPKLFPNVRVSNNALAIRPKLPVPTSTTGNAPTQAIKILLPTQRVGEAKPVMNALADLDADAIADRMLAGERLNIFRNLHGAFDYNFLPEPKTAKPRLMLIETYRLSSFLGTYGAGKVLKTFTLLPGESTKISIKTYLKTETEAKQASSILDSFTEESASDFETSLQKEQSNKENTNESFEYYAEAEAEGSWGFASANVSGGVKGGSNTAREEFAKNVSSTTQKHAAKASAKRDVQVNTSFESKVESGEETAIERQLENINVSRTLNFVFRQMNQEFITLLHLVDVKVAFFNGYAESRREVPLAELDNLLQTVMKDDPTRRQQVKQLILDELKNIVDYTDTIQEFVEEKQVGNGGTKYLRVPKKVSIYKDAATGTEIAVPGVILSAMRNVLRTEGIIVDALLGQGDGLDEYSHGLQDEAVREKALANEALRLKNEREQLALQIILSKDTEAAKLFQQLFAAPVVQPSPATTSGGNGKAISPELSNAK
ncbi:hypothetical protein H6G33_12090 [Calothrix sp. FACHB-1219]|uniref:hypothetical protein n=1 Tax=unclassified Calothrix TaxID=2619626 RepID=UPI001686E69E|nr:MULTISPECIES: hypothetical protein [unclassified Calothrix]MBD2202366.1 hypothetical protein [Calothrix sp. FACHB-168]MBD2217772.1 hypothetical protein [Calothrix sp. FACHB-1219]